MKKLGIIVFITVWLVAVSSLAEEYKYVNPGLGDEEAVLSKAIAIRAKRLEKKSHFHFDKKTDFKITLEYNLPKGSVASYEAETQMIHFAVSWMYELCVRYQQPLRLLDPETVANDKQFGEKADHELGHLLMDQVSRRSGYGPWFTQMFFYLLTREEQLGLNILTEGVGTYFEYWDNPDTILGSPYCLPANLEQQKFYRYEIITFQGGYWLIREILNKYGERGLVWITGHRFVARDDMRQAGIEWKKRALKALANK